MFIIYTAIASGKDAIGNVKPKFGGCKYVLYTDDVERDTDEAFSKGWDELRPLHHFSEDKRYSGRRAAKVPKVLSCMSFPDYVYTIWMDGTRMVIQDPHEWVEKFVGPATGKFIASFDHPQRDCIYAEGAHIRDNIPFLESGPLLDEQMTYYLKREYPRNYGLVNGSVLVRRQCLELQRLELTWWEQICKFSGRDQMSLMYSHWRCGTKDNHAIMPGHWERNKYAPLMRGHIDPRK